MLLLSGIAIIGALAFAGPVWDQRTGPGVGAPGPNQPLPGGLGPSSPMSDLPPRVGTEFPATDLPETARPWHATGGDHIGDASDTPARAGFNAPLGNGGPSVVGNERNYRCPTEPRRAGPPPVR